MTQTNLPEIWEWAEYYCPWCYIGAVRLHAIMPEFQGRVKMRIRPFPLEVVGGGPPNRKELDQERWLAALQEPRAAFAGAELVLLAAVLILYGEVALGGAAGRGSVAGRGAA